MSLPLTDRPLPPTTTIQQDRTLEGQRKVNLIWEFTQAGIALTVVVAYVTMVIKGIAVPTTLDNLLFVIITFYFARTNHTAIGGVGYKPDQEYRGR
jgi:hypothetical protein